MISIKPTENLTGVTIQGDFYDFYELVDTIHRMFTSEEDDRSDSYYGVKNRMLGICYDIRHAYMGDREVVLKDNAMSKELMKWHKIKTSMQNVYYSVNLLFPEAIFVAVSASHAFLEASSEYGKRGRAKEEKGGLPAFLYSDYIRDRANIEVFCAGIWQALGEAIGDEELEKLIRFMLRSYEDYRNYATHYIDKCNIELINTPLEKRKSKLKSIAKRMIKKPDAYYNMKDDLDYWAKYYNTSIYELRLPELEYPEVIEW